MKIYKILIADNYSFFESNSIFDNYKLQEHDYSCLPEMSFSLFSKKRPLVGDITVIDNSSLVLFSNTAVSVFPNEKYIDIKGIADYKLLELPFIDTLDYKKSKIDYFEGSSKQLKRIRKYVFLEEKLKDTDIFTLPIKGEPAFATENFVSKYKAAGLTGIVFHCIY